MRFVRVGFIRVGFLRGGYLGRRVGYLESRGSRVGLVKDRII